DAGIAPCSRKCGGTRRRRSRGVGAALEDTLLVDWLEAEGPEFRDPGIQLDAGKRARGGNNSDPIAGPERAGLAHALREPRHFGRNRLMLVAAENGTQRGATEWKRTWRRQKPFFCLPLARECILDTLHRQHTVLNRVNHRL